MNLDLTTEELEKIASLPDDKIDKTILKLDPVQKFCLENNITRGSTQVSSELIYDLYYHWRKSNRLNRSEFFTYFARHFERVRKTHRVVYLLNPDPFDFSEEKYWEIRRRARKERQKKNRDKEVYEENATRLKSISSAGKASEFKDPPG